MKMILAVMAIKFVANFFSKKEKTKIIINKTTDELKDPSAVRLR